MEDRSNIIKEAIEYRDKLEKKVEELAQSVVRLQISLDFADNTIKKKDRENAELKAENERLKEELATYGATGVCEVCSDKANKLADKYLGCLQEIKEIAVMDICSNCITQKREYNCQCLADTILQKITKAESEG